MTRSTFLHRLRTWMLLCCCCAVLVLGIRRPAGADPTPPTAKKRGGDKSRNSDAKPTAAQIRRAKTRYFKGQKLFGLRRFQAALREYEAAFEAAPLPDFLFNIGQCHRNLGSFDEAIFSFRRFLSLRPDTNKREQIEMLIAELERDRKRAAEERRPLPLVAEPSRRPPSSAARVYRRWWFWAGIAAVAAGSTAAIIVTTSGDSGLPQTDLGNLDFGK